MKDRSFFYLQKIALGVFLSLAGLLFFSLWQGDEFFKHMLLQSSMPNYSNQHNQQGSFYKFNELVNPVSSPPTSGENLSADKPIGMNVFKQQAAIEPHTAVTKVIGTQHVVFEPDTTGQQQYEENPAMTKKDIIADVDTGYMLKHIYNFDQKTTFNAEDFNINDMLSKNLTLENQDGPKILIYHTHAYEGYKDSSGVEDGVMKVGETLQALLENTYHIPTIHLKERFDLVDGAVSVNGAYQRSEAYIENFLSDYPTIEVVIDLHRDGVGDHLHLMTPIEGKNTAQIMFVNGISKILKNGSLETVENLPNPYIKDNLAFSLALQLEANEKYPGLMRKNYINAYRYALHLMPKSALVEIGAQTNSLEEAMAATTPLADILQQVLLK